VAVNLHVYSYHHYNHHSKYSGLPFKQNTAAAYRIISNWRTSPMYWVTAGPAHFRPAKNDYYRNYIHYCKVHVYMYSSVRCSHSVCFHPLFRMRTTIINNKCQQRAHHTAAPGHVCPNSSYYRVYTKIRRLFNRFLGLNPVLLLLSGPIAQSLLIANNLSPPSA